MQWTCLGHAMWLADVAGTRILFDPLLKDTFDGGVFRVHPARTVHAERLKPDLLVVSHRHPDHFDVPSLMQLAALDPTVVVLTADRLVFDTCRRIGFRDVGLLDDHSHVPLDGAALYTTPSFCDVDEWGMLVASDAGVVWNQVDSALGTTDQIADTLRRASHAIGRDARPDLLLARWQPLREVEGHTLGRLDFPLTGYAAGLDRIAAVAPRAVVPGAAGHHHVGDAAWLNQHAYPVSEARFLRDLKRRAPGIEGLPAVVGRTYVVRDGVHTVDSDLVTNLPDPDERRWDPLSMPVLVDPGPCDDDDRALVHSWVQQALAPALGRQARLRDRVCVLRVVWPDGVDRWTLHHGVTDGEHDDWDVLNIVAGSALVRVLRGQDAWGRPLLAGQLRAARRPYDVDESGVHEAPVPVVFLYAALSYERSHERWVDHLLGERPRA